MPNSLLQECRLCTVSFGDMELFSQISKAVNDENGWVVVYWSLSMFFKQKEFFISPYLGVQGSSMAVAEDQRQYLCAL